jgi:hypothetical protein
MRLKLSSMNLRRVAAIDLLHWLTSTIYAIGFLDCAVENALKALIDESPPSRRD